MVVATVGTSCLNIEVIGSVGCFGRSDAAGPTAGRIAPFIDFAPPAVENQCAEAHNAFVALLGFEHVVDPVAVGSEGIGKFEFTFGDGYAESIVLRVGHRVAVLDKRDQQPDGERAALGEFVTGVGVVAHEEGCGTPLAVKLPFVEGCARTVVGGTGFKTDPQRRAAVISRFFGFFAVGSDDHHRRLAVGTAGSAICPTGVLVQAAFFDTKTSILPDSIVSATLFRALSGSAQSREHSKTVHHPPLLRRGEARRYAAR